MIKLPPRLVARRDVADEDGLVTHFADGALPEGRVLRDRIRVGVGVGVWVSPQPIASAVLARRDASVEGDHVLGRPGTPPLHARTTIHSLRWGQWGQWGQWGSGSE